MKQIGLWLTGLIMLALTNLALSADMALLPVRVNIQDQSTLQRGAKMFMNYCSGCHSLRYMRFNRMAEDLGLTTFDGEIDTDLLFNNLVFTEAKIFDPIQIAMPAADAMQWFGMVPPDLSLVSRERGASWIYTYLKSFYVDKTRPFGANNLLKPDVAMPNVLESLSGEVILVDENTLQGKTAYSHLLQIGKGQMTTHEFDNALQDLVTFLVYVGEPAKLVRYRLGVGVIIFLCIFLVFAYQLKKFYWRRLPKYH